MSDRFQFADTFGQLVQQSHYTPGQLAALSGIPKTTIINWLEGRVQRPRQWQALVKLATALRLNRADTTALLTAAGYPPLAEILLTAAAEDHKLLAPWKAENVRFPTRLRPPFQAIAQIPYFVGRQAEMQALTEALLADQPTNICTITGMPGVGKTTLAAQLAYQLRDHFVDGVLWAQLGTSDLMSILSTFAAAYGRDVSRYDDLPSRSRIVRDLLADKQVLIILDNVPSSEAVKPLLPPTGRCKLLLTTRRHDLLAITGAYRLHLHPFLAERQDAQALFTAILGPEWVNREADMFAQLAQTLGYLPLALTLVAGRLAYEPSWSAADFVQRLRQTERHLDEFHLEDQSLRLSFDVSFDLLSTRLKSFFSGLAVFGGEDFADTAVAAINESDLAITQDRLRRLTTLSLINAVGSGRYRLHPLLRAYALEKATKQPLIMPMIDYFVAYAATHTQDYAALTPELGNILTALDTAFEMKKNALLRRGIIAILPFLQTRGRFDLAELHLQHAAALAETPLALATIHYYCGRLARLRRRYETATTLLASSQEVAQEMNDTHLLSAILGEQGVLFACLGDYEQSGHYLERALPLARQSGNDVALVTILSELALLAGFHGQTAQMVTYFQEGLLLARQLGRPQKIIPFLRGLGNWASSQGEFESATLYYEEGLTLARAIGDHGGSSSLLNNLGSVAMIQGQFSEAERFFQLGLAESQTALGQHPIVAMLIANLGEIAFEQGDFATAVTHFQTALHMAQELNHPELIILTVLDLAKLARYEERYEQAESKIKTGFALAQKIGHKRFVARLGVEHGNILFAQTALAAAEVVFREALAVIRPLQAQPEWAEALYGLAQVTAAQGDMVTANRLATEAAIMVTKIRPRLAEQIRQWQDDNQSKIILPSE